MNSWNARRLNVAHANSETIAKQLTDAQFGLMALGPKNVNMRMLKRPWIGLPRQVNGQRLLIFVINFGDLKILQECSQVFLLWNFIEQAF